MLFIKFASALLNLHAIYKDCMCSVKFPCFLLSLHAYYIKYACYLNCQVCMLFNSLHVLCRVFMFCVQFVRVLH